MPLDSVATFAVPDWEEKLRRGETPMPALPLNEKRAARATNLFNALRLPDVPGKPPLAEASGDWFRDIVKAALAAEDPETGQVLVNEVFCLVPKKNSKTTYAAALGLTAMLLWDLPNAQMLILGPTQAIAERCFKQAAGMIAASPQLSKIFQVQSHRMTIKRHKTGAELKVKTFALDVVTGEIPALTIIDELHVLGAKSGAGRVIAQITGGMVTNPAALLVYITTQSDQPPAGVFKQKLSYARAVRDGAISAGRFLAVLYEFSDTVQTAKDKPWRDPATWRMVTPNLHRSVNIEILRDNFEKAEREGADALIVWASQHLNIEIGLGLHSDRWVGADYWLQAQSDEPLDLDAIIERCEVAVVGIDGGGLDDLLGLAVIGRERGTSRWLHWGRAWADREVEMRRKSIIASLNDFEASGDFAWIDTPGDDLAEIAEICGRLNAAGLLPEKAAIGMDPEGVAEIVDAVIDGGLEIDQLVPVTQGYKLNAAIQGAPRKLKNGTLQHCGQGLMAWCVGNAKTEMRGNARIVTKAASGKSKIDPLMALFNAVQLMSWNPTAGGGAVVDIPDDYEIF